MPNTAVIINTLSNILNIDCSSKRNIQQNANNDGFP